MNNNEIEQRFRATIDQFYTFPSQDYIKRAQLNFIGGVLQSALHILPLDRYLALKEYIYEKYGYDPGGVVTGQIRIEEIL